MKETIIINSKDHLHFIKQSDILYCRSENYATHIVKIHGDKITAPKPLSTILKLLDGKLFVRVSQSYLVNAMHIVSIDKKEGVVLLSNKERIPYTICIVGWAKSLMGTEGSMPQASVEDPV